MTDSIGALKEIVSSSAQLSTWALAVLAGTLAAIVSTSYRRPNTIIFRLPYLLFLPGWAAIAYSLYLGHVIGGKYLASLLVRSEQVSSIASQINDVYSEQGYYLLCSLCFFGVWLVIFLLIWIFLDAPKEGDEK